MSEWNPIEEFDPSWSWRFKWGYSAQRNEAHAWRIPDREGDGRLTHRQEFTQTFGHAPFVQAGDQLGIASYIPEERMYDGRLVAPPEIQMHTYYGGQPHDKVYEWFLKKFPDVIVRKAYVGPEQKVAAAPQKIKWTWTEAGPEIGAKRFGPQAWTGLATIMPTAIEISADRETPQNGLAAIKVEFAKQYPDSQIIIPTGLHELHTPRPSSLERERIEQRHEAALQWADMFLPAEETHSEETMVEQSPVKRSFLDRFKRKAADGANMEGAMVALFIPKEVGRSLKVRGGEPVERMHITLAYFVEKASDRDDWDEVRKIVETIANQTPPLVGKIGGYGVFQNDDSPDVLWASPNLPGLEDLRQKVVEAVEDAGFKVSDEHGWVPHITLKYNHKGKLPRVDADLELKIESISFAQGDKHEDYDLTGEFVKTTNEWSGFYRYTVVPRGSLSQIMSGGLIPQQTDKLDPAAERQNPGAGVFVWRFPEFARQWNDWTMGGQGVILEVNIDGLAAEPDPNMENAIIVREPISPDRIRGEWNGQSFDRTSSWEMTEWKWPGTVRFVTDGKEILTEPEDQPEWRAASLDGLGDKFRSFFPDSKKSPASGWAIPTADGMGYGVWAPKVGWGSNDELGLHDLIHKLDSELKKPTHLVEEWGHIIDPKKYHSTHPD